MLAHDIELSHNPEFGLGVKVLPKNLDSGDADGFNLIIYLKKWSKFKIIFYLCSDIKNQFH